jgi:chemosensory pili system protein ChpA (sensor histidine kinase/response regulator)
MVTEPTGNGATTPEGPRDTATAGAPAPERTEPAGVPESGTGEALRDELEALAARLEVDGPGNGATQARLAEVPGLLDRVLEGLGATDRVVLTALVTEQRARIQGLVRAPLAPGGVQAAPLGEAALALRYIAKTLAQGTDGSATPPIRAGASSSGPGGAPFRDEVANAIGELRAGLARAGESARALAKAPERGRMSTELQQLLGSIKAELSMLQMHRAAGDVEILVGYVGGRFGAGVSPPPPDEVDALVEGIGTIDAYLGATEAHRPDRERILDAADQVIAVLGPVATAPDRAAVPEDAARRGSREANGPLPAAVSPSTEPAASAELEPTTGLDPAALETIEGALAAIRARVEEARAGGSRAVREDLVLALDALNRAASGAGTTEIGDLAGALSHYLKGLGAQSLDLDSADVDLLAAVGEAVAGLRRGPAGSEADQPDVGALLDRISARFAARGTAGSLFAGIARPEPAAERAPAAPGQGGSPPADAGLREIFLAEARDILEGAEPTLRRLRAQPGEPEPRQELQRALHNLKGGANMVGLGAVADLSHNLETAVVALEEARLTADSEAVRMVVEGFDRLTEMIDALATDTALPAVDGVVASLRALTAGTAPPSPTGEAKAPPAEGRAAAASEGLGERETVRVTVHALNRLGELADEAALARIRLEQRITGLTAGITQLADTARVLRDRVAELPGAPGRTGAIAAAAQPGAALEDDQARTLSRALKETAADVRAIGDGLANGAHGALALLGQQTGVIRAMQDELARLRRVPIASLVPRWERVLRRTAQEVGKRAELVLGDIEGELDRGVLEGLTAPLEHLIRNAVVHGIEPPGERREAGKPELGRVTVEIQHHGQGSLVRVSDDGHGLDLAALQRAAVAQGLLEPQARPGPEALQQLMLRPGFSTLADPSQAAGRGIGLDVVQSAVKRLGGGVEIHSEPGHGTAVTLRLPFSLTVNQALLLRVGDEVYAMPLADLVAVVRLRREELDRVYATLSPVYRHGDQAFPVHYLGALLATGLPGSPAGDETQPLLLLALGGQRIALHVDGVIGSEDVVVRSLGTALSRVPGIAGGAILTDGRVVLILDVAGLLRRGAAATLPPGTEAAEQGRVTVMVVDDSITVRKVAASVLRRHGLRVVTATDGIEALERLPAVAPDLLLVDVEMPRMDGLALARQVRHDPRWRHVPIIMISSRPAPGRRARADAVGVDRFLGKPYRESELLDYIRELTGRGPGHARG